MQELEADKVETLSETRKRRRWPQFGLRSLLIGGSFFGVTFGVFMQRVRTQQRAVAEIRNLSGQVAYEANWLSHLLPESIEKQLGVDACANVVSVTLSYRTMEGEMVAQAQDGLEEAVGPILRLPHVTGLSLHTLDLRDDDLAALAPLRNKIQYLSVNELFHSKLKGNRLDILASWKQLRSLTILSSGLDDSLNLEPLASLSNLTYLRIGIATLNEKAFTDIARMDSLQTLDLFECQFNGEHLRHLQKLSNLETLSLHNVHPEPEYESYSMDESGNLQPNGKATFRFDRSQDAWQRLPQWPLKERYHQWLKETLPNVQVTQMFNS